MLALITSLQYSTIRLWWVDAIKGGRQDMAKMLGWFLAPASRLHVVAHCDQVGGHKLRDKADSLLDVYSHRGYSGSAICPSMDGVVTTDLLTLIGLEGVSHLYLLVSWNQGTRTMASPCRLYLYLHRSGS